MVAIEPEENREAGPVTIAGFVVLSAGHGGQRSEGEEGKLFPQ